MSVAADHVPTPGETGHRRPGKGELSSAEGQRHPLPVRDAAGFDQSDPCAAGEDLFDELIDDVVDNVGVFDVLGREQGVAFGRDTGGLQEVVFDCQHLGTLPAGGQPYGVEAEDGAILPPSSVQQFEGFVLSGREVALEVRRGERSDLVQGGGEVVACDLPGQPAEVGRGLAEPAQARFGCDHHHWRGTQSEVGAERLVDPVEEGFYRLSSGLVAPVGWRRSGR